MKSTPSRCGSFAISLHWLSAVLVIILIISGFRSGFSDDAAAKATALRIHLPVAGAVFLLTLTRLIWWWRIDQKPAPIEGSPDWQEAIARWVHRLLYLLLIVLLGSGIAMSVMSGLPFALFGDAPLPNLAELPPRTPHGIAARVMVATILLHALAALYHHYIAKDRTLRRMWFGAS